MRCVEVTNWVGRAALSIMLIGCVGDATEPNEKNFAAALNTSLEKEGAFCLPLQFPVALNSGDLVVNSDRRKQMQALESVGLVHATEYELEERSVFGGTRSAKLPRYDLTPAGAEYRGQGGRGADQAVSGLCYGKPRLHRIVSWEGPRQVDASMVALVRYTYSIETLAPWANDAAVQGAFRPLRERVRGAGTFEKLVPLRLTNNGWAAAGRHF